MMMGMQTRKRVSLKFDDDDDFDADEEDGKFEI